MTEAKTKDAPEAGTLTAKDGVTPLTEEEVAERYQKPPVPKDPNAPISSDDPNDKIRAEGPEVADPAQAAAHELFSKAKADAPEATASVEPQSDDEAIAHGNIAATTGPGSGAANTSDE